MGRNAPGQVPDAELLACPDVVNIEVGAFGTHHHHALDQVIHEAEAAGLGPGPLDHERNRIDVPLTTATVLVFYRGHW